MNRRNILWLVPLAIFMLSPLWWGVAADFLALEERARVETLRPESSFVMEGVFLSQAKNGVDELFLQTTRMHSEKNQDLLFLEQPATTILNQKDKTVTVNGDEAIYETSKEILTMMGDVRLVTGNTLVLTPVMRYLAKYKKLKSAAAMELLAEGMRITGTSFMYDLESGNFRVGRRVHCELW